MNSIVTIKNLTFKYVGNQNVLKKINLEVKEGDFLCIVGENGSGKSTLLKCILGLNSVEKGKTETIDTVGYLPQKTEIQSNFPASIEEIVLSGTIVNNVKKIWYTKKDRAKANQIMKELKLYEIRKKSFKDLSGGQQQRVLIARALCSTNSLIVLDEPTNGLDPNVAKQIYSILSRMNKKKKITVLMVSHDVDRAMEYCNRLVEIKNGEIVYDGNPSDYREGGSVK